MSLININNLTFYYEGTYQNVFENVSFQLNTNWRIGLIGRNGRGKTTFLNLLMGKYKYSGNIDASVSFDYFPMQILDHSLSPLEIANQLIDGLEDWRLECELSLLNVSLDILERPYSTLSNGEQTKLLLAILFLKENNFLLIDEPTNHLDAEARKTIGEYLRNKNGFILVSHDRELLDLVVNYILSINRNDIDIQKGNFSSWWENKSAQDNYEMMENDKLKKDIRRLTQAAEQTAKWSDRVEKSKNEPLSSGLKPEKGYISHRAAKMMKRSKAIENRRDEAIEDKSRLLKNIEKVDDLAITSLTHHKTQLVAIEHLSISYNQNTIFNDINFTINTGDRIALTGKNGSGKSSILKLILGHDIQYSGKILLSSNLIISYVPQNTSFLQGSIKNYIQDCDIDETLFKTILRKLDFEREHFEKNLESFSDGQKKKILIAKSLCQKAHLYIWDEPLNYIDVFSRMQIENLIKTYKPTMLFVEHDNVFIEQIANKKIAIAN